LIRKELRDGVAIVALDHGVVNPLGPEMVQALSEALGAVREDPTARALVLTSANDKFFSIGLDIPELFPLSREEFGRFFHGFSRLCLELFTFPKPTVAALTGHALAGGFILTTCCDYRFIAEGRKLLGMNEVKLGVPVPYAADRILRELVGGRAAREICESGEFYPPEASLRLGLVDAVLPLGEVQPRAVEKARTLGSSPSPAYAETKRNRVERVEADILARMEEKDRLFVDLWYAPEARERLKAAMRKF
jgi:enoyl-CoA hydratase/carnithine racemase